MNRSVKRSIYALVLLLPLMGIIVHYVYLRPSIASFYEGHPNANIDFLVRTLYPRFSVEKERFDLLFFLTKADQVLFRFLIVYYLLLLVYFFYTEKKSFQIRMQKFFTIETSSKNIDVLRIIFFGYFLYLSYELLNDLLFKQALSVFYKPIYLLSVFHIPFPSATVVIALGAVWYASTILTLFNIKPVLCTTLSLLLFLLFQCWTFSFEKLDHGYSTITYAFLLLPFLFDEQQNNKPVFQSWALQLIRISIAMVYLLTSLEKLIIAQLSWLNPNTLRTYLSFHETPLSLLIIENDFWCTTLSTLALLLQLTFILILFLPKFKWVWVVGGILFHTGTLLIMGIGTPLNPWILVYIFFFDWTYCYDFFSGSFKKGHHFSN